MRHAHAAHSPALRLPRARDSHQGRSKSRTSAACRVVDADRRLAFDLRRIAGGERSPVHLRAAAHDVHVGATSRRERVRHRFVAGEKRRVDASRPAGSAPSRPRRRGDAIRRRRPRFASSATCVCSVARLDARDVRLDPDLQEVRPLVRRRVELAVPDAAARAHALHVARRDDRAGARCCPCARAARRARTR